MAETGTELIERVFDSLTQERGSAVGLDLQPDLPFDDWKQRCAAVGTVRSFGPFALGDVFRYGAATYGEKRAFADGPVRLADHTPAFIHKCAEVCGRIPHDRRKLGLSFEHHVAVAKLKSPGCSSHQAVGPEADCAHCELARLDEIGDWLTKASNKKWTAKELKDQLADHRSTTVREHQRSLDGAEFDAEGFKGAVNLVKHFLSASRDQLSGLITPKGKLDRTKAKRMLDKAIELQVALNDLIERTKGSL